MGEYLRDGSVSSSFSPFSGKVNILENDSLSGRHSKGKGKGIRGRDHTRGRREEGNACKEAIVFVIPPTN